MSELVLPLAVEVDFVTLGSLIVSLVTISCGAITTGWFGAKKICIYLWEWGEPKITEVVAEHTGLVSDMRSNVPVVADTMRSLAESQAKLVETQVQQCDTLRQLSDASDRHEELHKTTATKLDRIMDHLSAKDIPTQQ